MDVQVTAEGGRRDKEFPECLLVRHPLVVRVGVLGPGLIQSTTRRELYQCLMTSGRCYKSMVTAYGSLLGGGGGIQVHKAGDMAVVAVAWIINHIYGSNRA